VTIRHRRLGFPGLSDDAHHRESRILCQGARPEDNLGGFPPRDVAAMHAFLDEIADD
jgi:hypothetical protein